MALPPPRARERALGVLALAVVAAIAYLGSGEHPTRYIPAAIDPHPWRNLFLLLFARQLFGAGVAYVIFATLPILRDARERPATLTGGMRIVARILSAAPWTPLARLSYAAYLVELVCILPLYAYFSHGLATARTFSELVPILAADGAVCVGRTFVVALFFHVLVEKPFVNLR